MNDLTNQINELSPLQRQLLLRWLQKSTTPAAQDSTARQRILAYVVANHAGDHTASIVQHLRDALPRYMVPDDVTVLPELPRLPNGKVNFNQLPNPQQNATATADTFVGARNDIERELMAIWSELLRTDMIDVRDNFFEIGGDSIITIQVVSRAREAGLKIEPKQIAMHPTIATLATVVTRVEPSSDVIGVAHGQASTTPIQRWFFENQFHAPHHWNQIRRFKIDPRLTASMISTAVDMCVEHHDALRARFRQHESIWTQLIPEREDDSPCDILPLPPNFSDDQIQALIATQHASFDLESGPLVRFMYLQSPDSTLNQLAILAHHLVIDNVSWGILIEDLQQIGLQLIEGQVPRLPNRTTSVIDWSRKLEEYSVSESCRQSVSHWQQRPPDESVLIPLDKTPEHEATERDAKSELAFIDTTRTQQLLTNANEAYKTRSLDLLITALVQTLTDWTLRPSCRIDLEGHGREWISQDLRLDRTVGWFTSFFPVTLSRDTTEDTGNLIKSTKEQLRGVPNQGFDYGVLRYLSGDDDLAKSLAEIPSANVLFNFSGTNTYAAGLSLLKPISSNKEAARSADNRRSHLLEINASVVDDQLETGWVYSEIHHDRATIERLADQFATNLSKLIDHCVADNSTGFTPSDFPDVDLSQDELDSLFD